MDRCFDLFVAAQFAKLGRIDNLDVMDISGLEVQVVIKKSVWPLLFSILGWQAFFILIFWLIRFAFHLMPGKNLIDFGFSIRNIIFLVVGLVNIFIVGGILSRWTLGLKKLVYHNPKRNEIIIVSRVGFSTSFDSMPVNTINKISVQKGSMGKLLGYGTMIVSSFAPGRDLVYPNVKDSREFFYLVQSLRVGPKGK